jgi:hypothetical protein
MRSVGLLPLAALLALFAVACGADTEQTTGRFDDESNSSGNEDPTAAPRKASSSSGGAAAPAPGTPEGAPEPTPALPGDPAPPSKPVDPTPTARTCSGARDLGTISGDVGADQVVAQGNCSDWVKVRVTEKNTYPVGDSLEVTATLVSPSPDDFDVYAYVNEAADAIECSTVNIKSDLPASRSDVIKVEFGETYWPNASDDSRTVTFEVRKKTAGCSVGSWSLLVQGNR